MKIKSMNCCCGSCDVAFRINLDEDTSSNFTMDLVSRWGNPFGTPDGKVVDVNKIKDYIIETYEKNLERMFVTDFALGDCFGKCEDETECVIIFEDGVRFQFQNDSNPNLYTFNEYLSSEEKALMYMCGITNQDILDIKTKQQPEGV